MAEKTQEQIRKEQEEAEKKRQEQAKKQQEDAKKQQQTRSATGKVSTYSATTGGMPMADPRGEDRRPSREEIEKIGGDLFPGELAWVKLDEEGTPQGPAIRDIPERDEVVARVFASPRAAWEDVVTPSGAPITKYMNPDPQMWDAGMLERNPIPDDGGRTRDKRIPAGGGVINQPVTT